MIAGTLRRAAAGALEATRPRRFDPLPYLLLLPALTLIVVFAIAPVFYGFVVSLHRVQVLRLGSFVGTANYQDLLADERTWNNLAASFVFTGGSVVLTLLFGFLLALALNERLPLRPILRVVVLIPWITSYVVTYLIAKWMLDLEWGLVNTGFREVGLPPQSWLSDPRLAMFSLTAVNVWRTTPYALILLLAGLQGIPSALYEAASVDGASALQRFVSITLPLMRTPLMITTVILTIFDFNVVVAMIVLTGGGPGHATETLSLRMYEEAFGLFRMGTAASVSTIIFAINLSLSLLYFAVLRQRQAM